MSCCASSPDARRGLLDAPEDLDQYAGSTYETVVHNGTGTDPVVSDTITDPWSSTATATHALDTSLHLPDQHAYFTGSSKTRVYTPLSSGSTRETETDFTHDSLGRVVQATDLGDTSTATDDQCAATTFDDNTTANILNAPDDVTTVSGSCAPISQSNAISEVRTYYDGATTFGTPPTIGDATKVETASTFTGTTAAYATTSSTVDEYGRTLTSTDADNRTTHTVYTPATGAEPTAITLTDPMTHVTRTTYDPLRDLTLQSTDPGNFITKQQYDALGRLTAVFKPGITSADLKYSYVLGTGTTPSVVTTQTLDNDGTYRTSEVLYDALLRARETQAATTDGNRQMTDTVYNTDGLVAKSTDTYVSGGALTSVLQQPDDGSVPSETGYTYDGAGRQTAAISYALGTETWRTTTVYGGNVTTTIPPQGGTAQSVITDARGNTTDLYQYHAGVPTDPVSDPASDYSDTHYTYYPSGKEATEVDAAGNTWSWTYDLLGDQTSATDPDTGTTTSTYDDAGQLKTVTDARAKQTSYVYDTDGRKKLAYDTTGGAAESASDEIAAWTYDTIKKGYPTASTSYQMGTTSPSVTSAVLGYSGFGTPAATKETLANLPADESALAPSAGYTTSYTFRTNGLVASSQDSAAAGLPAETVDYGYDAHDEPVSADGTGTTAWDYAQAVGYNDLGQPVSYLLGGGANTATLDLAYDPQTRVLTEAKTSDTASASVDDVTYDYGSASSTPSQGAGLLLSTKDTQDGTTTDQQCFTYDYATRLAGAWTATDNCAATPAAGSSSTVGGPNPYWQTWTYDAAGDRQTQTDHATTGVTADDTTTTYHYPAAGSSSDQPHTLTSTSATGPGAPGNTASYGYDADGNTTSISGGSAGEQALTWNDQGDLASDTTVSGSTTYLYDADDNLALRTDPGQATLFVGDEQIVEDTGTSALSGTRYYSVGGEQIAERSSSGDIQYLIPDRQGTDTLAIDAAGLAVTRRQYTPFGQARGTAPAAWPGGDQGYVGGTPDATTSLENLGAREYDPVNGRFLSADPVLESTDPTQLGGYDYAGNDPVTGSDPTGQFAFLRDGNGDPVKGGQVNGQAHHPIAHHVPLMGFTGNWSAPSPAPRAHPHRRAPSNPVACARFGRCSTDPGPSLTTYLKEAGHLAYKYSGAADVVNCVTNPSLSGCTTAGVEVAGFFLTGGEDEGLIIGVDALEDGADQAATHGAEDVAGDAVKSCEHSFLPATPVLLANGTTKPIKDVRAGDKVKATDPITGKTKARTVERLITTKTDKHFAELTIKSTSHTATLTATVTHPFWVQNEHLWVTAGNLKPHMRLRTASGTTAVITAVHLFTHPHLTHDLTIATTHTYYVLAGNTPVLVHNSGGACPLYRSDTRGPDEIFESGFEPRGDNMDLLEHASGYSRDSGYISTTTSESVAIKRGGNVYEIRGVDGVDVNKEFPGNPFAHERETAIPGRVDTSCIVACRLRDGTRVPNPNYGEG